MKSRFKTPLSNSMVLAVAATISLGCLSFVVSAVAKTPDSKRPTKTVTKPSAVVNFDDPNMAVTEDYVGDAASACLKNADERGSLEHCLKSEGLLNKSEIEQALFIVRATTPTQQQRGIATESPASR